MQTPDFLPHRLNFDAIVCWGCTMKEMQTIAAISLTANLVFWGMLLECLLGHLLLGLAIAFPSAVGVGWCMAKALQRIKQSKPPGYLRQRFYLWCADKQLMAVPYIRRSGRWSLGRVN